MHVRRDVVLKHQPPHTEVKVMKGLKYFLPHKSFDEEVLLKKKNKNKNKQKQNKNVKIEVAHKPS